MKPEIAELLSFRTLQESDKSYIFSSWLGVLSDAPVYRDLHPSFYRPLQKAVIQTCLEKGITRVCCLKEDESAIVGYMVTDGDILHWINVKHPYRKFGIASHMVKTFAPTLRFFTHHPSCYHAAKKDRLNLRYNPFYIWSVYYGISQGDLHPPRSAIRWSGEGIH